MSINEKHSQKFKQNKPSTLVEVQAEISRELNVPFTTKNGVTGVVSRLLSRESLIKQAFQHAIGDTLLLLTARTPPTSMHNTLPNLQKMRVLLKEPSAPEQVDTAYLYAVKASLSRLAHQQYQQEGRGIVVLDLTKGQESDTTPAWYASQTISKHPSSWAKKARQHIASYNPEQELVVALLRPDNDVRIYRVELAWR
jgi:hypothetical protein